MPWSSCISKVPQHKKEKPSDDSVVSRSADSDQPLKELDLASTTEHTLELVVPPPQFDIGTTLRDGFGHVYQPYLLKPTRSSGTKTKVAIQLSTEEKTVSDLTVEELTQIVREIIQESLEKCLVSGSMEGRAKVNLAVVGSVEAKMVCDFEEKLD